MKLNFFCEIILFVKIIANNKKAFFDYEVIEKFEAGIVLLGCEIKSIREGKVNLKGSYITIKQEEIWLKNVHVSSYKFCTEKVDPLRERKLLLNKREIKKIQQKLNEQGITCVPLAMGLKKNYCKLEIALVRGKKKYDKRASLKKRDQEREIAQKIKQF